LPDGLFSNPNPYFWYILEGLEMESVGIYYGHLVCFTAIWSFCLLYGQLLYFGFVWYIFPHFGMFYKEKSGVLRAARVQFLKKGFLAYVKEKIHAMQQVGDYFTYLGSKFLLGPHLKTDLWLLA
jgi:hypothetical protein